MTSEDDIRGFIFKRIIYHLQYKNVLELKIDGGGQWGSGMLPH